MHCGRMSYRIYMKLHLYKDEGLNVVGMLLTASERA